MDGIRMAQPGIKVELLYVDSKEFLSVGDVGSEYVTFKGLSNPLVGMILIDFHMGLGLYRWQYISYGLVRHRNRGMFVHENFNDAVQSGVNYFHVLTEGKFRNYRIWWRDVIR